MKRTTFFAMAAMVGMLAMGMTTPAHADAISPTDPVQIWVEDPLVNGGAWTEVASGTTAADTGKGFTYGPYTFDLSATTNLTGSPSTAFSFGTQNAISSTGAGTLNIIISAAGFAMPTAPPTLLMTSTFAPTAAINIDALGTYQSYADVGNAGGTAAGYTPTPGSYTTGPQTLIASTTAGPLPVPVLAGPYSLVQTFSTVFSGAGALNSSSTTILASVPEPSTMALAGLGALGLITYGLRRRKAMGA